MRTVALLCLMSIACASAQLGSWSDVTKNPAVTPEVKDAANFVLQQANNKDSGLLTAKKGNLSIVRVEDVSTQVVSGINIKMSLLVMDESGQEFEITVSFVQSQRVLSCQVEGPGAEGWAPVLRRQPSQGRSYLWNGLKALF